jgi:hypothetical protein
MYGILTSSMKLGKWILSCFHRRYLEFRHVYIFLSLFTRLTITAKHTSLRGESTCDPFVEGGEATNRHYRYNVPPQVIFRKCSSMRGLE